MPNSDAVVERFKAVFGRSGGDLVPGNVGESRNALSVCQEPFGIADPVLFKYFEEWDKRSDGRNPIWIERSLLCTGQWESAWALAQLHYDQILKKEVKDAKRFHKGHPLCNLAIVAREVGSPSLSRHYALLSSAGDIYWEHENADLRWGGLAPTMLEQFESREQHENWRKEIREHPKLCETTKAVYLEPFLATRWFSPGYADHVLGLAQIEGHNGKPFVEVLLDAVESPCSSPAAVTGTRFEAAAGLLLSSTPGFEVDSARKTIEEQIDLVVRYKPDHLADIGLGAGNGLVECKSSGHPVGVRELRDFGAKCQFHRVKFGILIARTGTTGEKQGFKEPQSAELVRRGFEVDGLLVLVLQMQDLRGKCRELRGLLVVP